MEAVLPRARLRTRRKRPRWDRVFIVLATLVTLAYVLRDVVVLLRGEVWETPLIAVWLYVYVKQRAMMRLIMRSEKELPIMRLSWVWLCSAWALWFVMVFA